MPISCLEFIDCKSFYIQEVSVNNPNTHIWFIQVQFGNYEEPEISEVNRRGPVDKNKEIHRIYSIYFTVFGVVDWIS